MKHTPGPWEHQVWHGIHQTVIDANGETVAFDISTRDNAQLIAAAPEMLEALEYVLSTVKGDKILTEFGKLALIKERARDLLNEMDKQA